jgi:acyl-CoA thioester hydrolase
MDATALSRWPLHLEVTVAWGEMDAFGHVNHTVYLRWCESARIAYFEATGMLQTMRETGEGPILARMAVDYRKPVVFPAQLRVAVTVSKLGQSSFVMGYRVTRAEGAEVVAEAESVVVMVNYRTGEKVALSAALRARIAGLEAQGQT